MGNATAAALHLPALEWQLHTFETTSEQFTASVRMRLHAVVLSQTFARLEGNKKDVCSSCFAFFQHSAAA